MPTNTRNAYDVVILGSGSAGFSAAEAARRAGASVCIIERAKLGGECPNWACVPSKALLKAAKAYRHARDAGDYGVQTGKVSVDFSRVMAYRESVVERITGGGERGERYEKIAKQLEVDVVFGEGAFEDPHTILVNDERIEGKAILIATGTRDFIPPIDGLDGIPYLTFKEAVGLKRQPKSLAVIGGGPVGSELATFYGSIGTRVLLFQAAPTILNREDPEIAEMAHEAIRAHGVTPYGNAMVTQVKASRGGVVALTAKINGNEEHHAVEKVLVATGKRANIEGLHLTDVGVKLDERGNPKTDADQRTSVKHIFAAGDVDGGLQFTHTAHHEGSVAGHNAALTALKKRKEARASDERVVPRATFVAPEVASVGMTAEQAKEKHGKALVGRYKIAALGRSVTENSRQGLVKIVAHPKTRKVLGCHIMSDRAGEMIHEAALAMYLRATVDKVGEMIHAFPTYSEGIVAAANSVEEER